MSITKRIKTRNMNNILLTTVKNSGHYYFLISAARAYLMKKNKKNYDIQLFKKKKYVYPIFFILKNIFTFIYFNPTKIVNFRYRNYKIGRYTIPMIFKKYNSYNSKTSLFINTLTSFYRSCCIVDSTREYFDEKRIDTIFIDHCMYENGILLEIFLSKKIKVISLGYPKGIFIIENSKKKNLSYERIIQIDNKKKLNEKQLARAKKSLREITYNTEKIPWMKNIKFKYDNFFSNDKITHIVYLHSFTDAQLLYGFDGFLNVYEWIQFTIKELIKNKKNKILIKAHPSIFHTKFPTNLIKYDQKICNQLLLEYSNVKNVNFIIKPIRNIDILKNINKKCILISHHGSAILEGLYCGFKCISSEATLWNKKYQLTNSWSNKNQYKNFLNRKWDNLRFCNNEDFYNISYQLYCSENGLYGKNFWQQIISKKLKIKREDLFEKPKEILSEHLIKTKKKKLNVVLNEISKTIELIQV